MFIQVLTPFQVPSDEIDSEECNWQIKYLYILDLVAYV